MTQLLHKRLARRSFFKLNTLIGSAMAGPAIGAEPNVDAAWAGVFVSAGAIPPI